MSTFPARNPGVVHHWIVNSLWRRRRSEGGKKPSRSVLELTVTLRGCSLRIALQKLDVVFV
jgi:hypothetical protein